MQTDPPQIWTDEMIAQFRDYCFPKHNNPECKFDIFEKNVYLRIEDEQDDSQNPRRSMHVTYSCHTFGGWLLQSIPFYLVLSGEADYYKESNIGYVQILNGRNCFDEPEAKILAYVRQDLGIESYLDKVVSDTDRPPGFGKVITLRLDHHQRDKWNTTDSVGTKLPIRELEIEYTRGQPKEKWPRK